jgi:hypothetical protein
MPLVWKIVRNSAWQTLDSATTNAVNIHWANGTQGWVRSDSFHRQPVYICFPSMEILHDNIAYTIAQVYEKTR